MKPHYLALILVATTACSSNKPASTINSEGIPGSTIEPWFCQVGHTNEEWDCIRSEPLAKAHKPTRLPEPRRDAQNSTGSVSTPTSNTARATQLAAAPLRQNNPAPVMNKPNPAPQNTSSASPPRSAKQSVKQTQTKRDLPVHVALSYRPDKPVAILDLPKDFFAVQLVAVSTKRALEDFAKKHKIKGMSAARTYNGENLFYVLILGIYETRANAIAAIESLASPFDKMNPWIRPLGSLQESMLEADDQAGTTDI